MKKKLNDFEKEKKQLKIDRNKQFVLLLLMTCVAFLGFIIVLFYLISLIH